MKHIDRLHSAMWRLLIAVVVGGGLIDYALHSPTVIAAGIAVGLFVLCNRRAPKRRHERAEPVLGPSDVLATYGGDHPEAE